jgi:hypothetical protein
MAGEARGEEMNTIATVISLLGATLVPARGLPQAGCDTARPLERQVTEFHAHHMQLIDALFELGRTAGICLGVDALDSELLRNHVDLDAYSKPAGEIIGNILAASPRLESVESAGVVLVRRKGSRPWSWLDFVLPSFQSGRAPLQAVNNLLYMTLVSEAEPAAQGFAGSFRSGDLEDLVGPFSARDKTVRDLLCLLVTNGAGGMWIVHGTAAWETAVPKGPFWTLLGYSEPADSVARVLKHLPPAPELQ